jgi:uridine kinase
VPHLRWREVEAALGDLRRIGRTEVRAYDWEVGVIRPPAPIEGRAWLVEGLFTLRPELRGLYDLSIWVQGALETRMDRVIARDGAHMIPHWERDWVPAERAYMAAERPWLAADIIVAGAGLEIGALGESLSGSVPPLHGEDGRA